MKNLATIVPPESKPGSFVTTNGTKVLLPDGSELHGVRRIQLTADANDIWRARIDCIVNVSVMPGVAIEVVNTGVTITWWRRFLLRLAGVEHVNVTTLQSKGMEYARV